MTFDGYSSLAGSIAVLRTSLDAIEDASITMSTFSRNSDVVELVGPQHPGQDAPLVVEHSVRGNDPETTAALTEAWALTTLEQVQASRIADLESLRTTTTAELERRKSSLQLAEDSWEAFMAGDERGILQGRLEALTTRIAAAGDRIDELDRDMSRISARQAFLSSQLADGSSDGTTSGVNQLDALTTAGFISEQIASQLRILLEDRPNLAEGLEANLLTVMLRAELQEDMIRLISHQAERVFLEQQLASYKTRAETLRGQIAQIETQAVRLRAGAPCRQTSLSRRSSSRTFNRVRKRAISLVRPSVEKRCRAGKSGSPAPISYHGCCHLDRGFPYTIIRFHS